MLRSWLTFALFSLVVTCHLAAQDSPAVEAPLTGAELTAVREAEAARIAAIDSVYGAVVAIYGNDRGGGGSGVLYDPAGLAITNHHVVAGAGTEGWAGLADGKLYRWRLIGTDPGGDVAIIQLLGKDKFPVAPLGNSDTVRVGDFAMAMGNPFVLAEDQRPTVTLGIISGIERYQAGAGDNMLVYGNCIQVDSSINPGNSGGPLFNMRGEVIGINGRGSFKERGRVNVGLGYAISINQVKHFLPDLLATRMAQHGTLDAIFGNRGGEVICHTLNLDSKVADLGLQLGDKLLAFEGHPITNANQFTNLITTLPAGWPCELTFQHADEAPRTVHVRLTPLPYGAEAAPPDEAPKEEPKEEPKEKEPQSDKPSPPDEQQQPETEKSGDVPSPKDQPKQEEQPREETPETATSAAPAEAEPETEPESEDKPKSADEQKPGEEEKLPPDGEKPKDGEKPAEKPTDKPPAKPKEETPKPKEIRVPMPPRPNFGRAGEVRDAALNQENARRILARWQDFQGVPRLEEDVVAWRINDALARGSDAVGEQTLLVARDGRFVVHVNVDGKQSRFGYDGQEFWTAEAGAAPEPIDGERLLRNPFAAQSFMLATLATTEPLASIGKVQLDAGDKAHRQLAYRIKAVDAEGDPFYVWLSVLGASGQPEVRLLKTSEAYDDAKTPAVLYDDWQASGGLLLPAKRYIVSGLDEKVALTITLERAEPLREVDAQVFRKEGSDAKK
jgi:S1-C subfamily serine protease